MREERRYFVYIMTNPSKTLYTGITNSIRRRVREHKLKLTPGFAAKYNITRLVYFESFGVRNAIEREKQIKAWTRAKRVALIESMNPQWNDLSRDRDQPQTFRIIPRTALSRSTTQIVPSEARDLGSCLRHHRLRRKQTPRSLALLGMTTNKVQDCHPASARIESPIAASWLDRFTFPVRTIE